MKNLQEKTLAELVNQSTAAAGVFEKYHLDFCCKGKRPLREACATQGIDLNLVTGELEAVFSNDTAGSDSQFNSMELDELATYIVDKHHAYVRQMIPFISAHTSKVADRHGNHEPSLVKIAERWSEVAEEMTQHMFKEEKILFPFITRLAAARRCSASEFLPGQSFVANPIRVMEMEHDHAGSLMEEIRQLSNDYTPPLVACTTYRLSFNELKEFEEDLHRHVYLENHILFPKAIELEGALLAGTVLKVAGTGVN